MVRALPDHSLLDRLVRGRVWIPLLGVLLAGIVATQVEVLRLNASMGTALRQSATLSVRNQALRASVAELSDDARIERLAAAMGMVFPGPTTLSFVPAQGNVMHAVSSIHSPDPSQFAARLPQDSSGSSSGSGTTGSASSSSTSSGGSSDTGSSSSSSGSTDAGGSAAGNSGSTDAGGSAGGNSGSTDAGGSAGGSTDTSAGSGSSGSGSSAGG